MSSFSKFDIFVRLVWFFNFVLQNYISYYKLFQSFQGPDVVELLQRLCSADVDEPVGSTVYSGMQNQNGGYVTDCTLSRLSHNQYVLAILCSLLWICKNLFGRSTTNSCWFSNYAIRKFPVILSLHQHISSWDYNDGLTSGLTSGNTRLHVK